MAHTDTGTSPDTLKTQAAAEPAQASSGAPARAGRRSGQQRQGTATSTMQDIWDLLRIGHPMPLLLPYEQELRFEQRRFKRGEMVYEKGQDFNNLFIVRLGFLKTILCNILGDERVLSFPMQGDLLGFDGIYYGYYTNDTVALTDGELIVIPFKDRPILNHSSETLAQMICRSASRTLALERCAIGLTIPVKSKTRVARFLAMQAKRFSDLGYSSRNFILPMSRRELGSYLGLTLETASRSLSALARAGIIEVAEREIRILQPDMLGPRADFSES